MVYFVCFAILSLLACCNSFKPNTTLLTAITQSASSTSLRGTNTLGDSSDLQQTFKRIGKTAAIIATGLNILLQPVSARPEGVNRPELLPKGEKTAIIDVANFLSKGQEKKLRDTIAELEKSTGYKLRLVCQSYPNTPGSAIKEYWDVDDKTVIIVADRGEGFNRKGYPGNLVNLNIGAAVEDALPNNFWLRLTNKLGNVAYVRKNGEDVAVINVVEAISYCLQTRECKDLPFSL